MPSANKNSVTKATASRLCCLGITLATLSLQAQFSFDSSLEQETDDLTISGDGLTLTRESSLQQTEPPVLTVQFIPGTEPNAQQTRSNLGTLLLSLAEEISHPSHFSTDLRISGPMSSLKNSLKLQFRVPSSSSGLSASVELLTADFFPSPVQNKPTERLSIELIPIGTEPKQSNSNTILLNPGQNELTVFGTLHTLPTLSGEFETEFVNAEGPATMKIKGIGTSKVEWGDPVPPRTKANVYQIEPLPFTTHAERPFQLGNFHFFNSTVYTASLIEKLELKLSISIPELSVAESIHLPIDFEGTTNSSDVIASADIVKFPDSETGTQIPNTEYYLYFRFSEPTLSGFTQGNGLGAFEDQEASAELWALISEQQALSSIEISRRFQSQATGSNIISQARWNSTQIIRKTNVQSLDIHDYNGDTRSDLIAIDRGGIQAWLGSSGEQLLKKGDRTLARNHGATTFGDFNGDGNRDIALLGDKLLIAFSNGDGTFDLSTQEIPGSTGGDLVSADLDGDEDLDLVVALLDTGKLVTYQNLGTGEFEVRQSSELGTLESFSTLLRVNMALGDLDNDGDPDLAIARIDGAPYGFGSFDETATGAVWRNDSGLLTRTHHQVHHTAPVPLIVKSNFGDDVTIEDLNGDRLPDIVIPSYTSYDGIGGMLRNLGAGSFFPELTPSIGIFASKIFAGDINHDGSPDIIANGHANQESFNSFELWTNRDVGVSVRLGTEPGSFEKAQMLTEEQPTAIAVGDLNEDGLQDIAVAGSTISLYLRDLSSSRQFATEATEPVHIEDPVVRNVISRKVGKSAGNLTQLDLATIRDLSFHRNGLTELNLPPGLVNLESISISHNSITELYLPPDITKLKALYHTNPSADYQEGVDSLTLGPGFRTIETLGLLGLGVKEIHFEATMPNLKTIGLWGNRVQDVTFLAMTPNVETINLGDNGISTLTIPMGPSSLESLTLSSNPIKKLFVPEGFVVSNLYGLSPLLVEEYVPQPIVLPPSLDPDRGLVFKIIATDGPVSIDRSTNLRTWTPHSELEIQNQIGVLAIPIDKGADSLFFRAYRR